MAASLGSLVVSLGLNAAEFTTGLSKAEFEAQRFAKRLDAGIATAARAAAVGIGLIVTAAIAAGIAVDQLVKEAAKFKDLEEITGASAESLASFAVSARVAGTDMNTVAAASVKLTKNLTGVDDESSAAGAAIKALGLNIRDFKQLDPAAQIEVISKALAGFQDGAAKTAVALALFGKTGAELLPFLKELGDGIGRQTILTQAQIEAADKYSDAQARATATLHEYLQVVAIQSLPALTAFTNAAKDAIKELVGLDESSGDLAGNDEVRKWSERSVVGLGFVISSAEGAVRVFQILGETILGVADIRSKALTFDFKGALEASKQLNTEINRLLNKPLFSDRIAAEVQKLRDAEKFPGEGGGRRRERPALDFPGPAKTGAGADRVSEAQRFLESLQKQIDKTLELTTLETSLKEIQSGRLKGLTPAIESQIIAVSKQIDAYKELQVWLDKTSKAFDEEVRALQAADKERERATKLALDQAQNVADANNALRDEIAIILGGDAARKALEKDHVAAAIAIKEERLAQLQLDDARKGEAAGLAAEITFLKERAELLKGKDVAEQLAKDAKNFQEFKNIFADNAANSLTDFITGTKTAKEAFTDFAKSVNAQLVKIASQNFANELFGGTNGQGFDFGKILSQLTGGALGGKGDSVGGAFSKLFGGGTTAAATGGAATADAALSTLAVTSTTADAALGTLAVSAAANDAAFVTVSASAAVVDASLATLSAAAATASAALIAVGASSAASGAGSLIGNLFQGFGQSAATGTDFARGGWTLVGERGPEIVDLPPGARVTANSQLGMSARGPTHLSVVVNVPRGTSGQSADQIGLYTAAHLQRTLSRNG